MSGGRVKMLMTLMTKFGPRGHTPSHNSDWLDMLLIVPVTHRCMWVCLKMLCTPLYPMVLLIIIPFLNGYFIGNIPNIFRQTHVYTVLQNCSDVGCVSYFSAKSSPLFCQAPSANARNLCCMSNYWTYNVPPRQLSWSITTITRVYDQFMLGISRVSVGFINQLIL